MKLLTCLVGLFMIAGLVMAADVSGNYSGIFRSTGSDGQTNESDVYVILKQNGTEITGSGGPDLSRQFPITKGKIAGTKITGEAVNPDGPVYKLNLTVNGEKIAGEVDVVLPDGQVQKGSLTLTKIR
jgi:hypothetical protein